MSAMPKSLSVEDFLAWEVCQDAAAAEVFFRGEKGEFASKFVATGGMLRMPEVGVEMPLSDCYGGLA